VQVAGNNIDVFKLFVVSECLCAMLTSVEKNKIFVSGKLGLRITC